MPDEGWEALVGVRFGCEFTVRGFGPRPADGTDLDRAAYLDIDGHGLYAVSLRELRGLIDSGFVAEKGTVES